MIRFLITEDDHGPVLLQFAERPAALLQDRLGVELREVTSPVVQSDPAAFFEVSPDFLFAEIHARLADGLVHAPDDGALGVGGETPPEGRKIPLRHALEDGFRRVEDLCCVLWIRGRPRRGRKRQEEEENGDGEEKCLYKMMLFCQRFSRSRDRSTGAA